MGYSDVDWVYDTVKLNNYRFQLDNGTWVQTCEPALGYSFGAGSTDGVGDENFKQGNNKTKDEK